MGLYRRRDSPFWWMTLSRLHARPLAESTKIPVAGGTAAQTTRNRQLAEAAYAARMGDLARARFDLPGGGETIAFTEWADWYGRHVSIQKRGRVREAEILKTLVAAFGSLALADVTRDRVREWLTARARTVRAATANRELDLLKHMLVEAVPRYLPRSPIAGLARLHAVAHPPRILRPTEDAPLLEAVGRRERALVLCALDGLLRLSEVLALRRDEVHGHAMTIAHPKAGPPRVVPLSRRLEAALAAVPGRGRYFFAPYRAAKNARDWRGDVEWMFERACGAAGIPYGREHGGMTFHGLRHTGASRMVEAGHSLRVVQQIGGWASLRQLERYTHPTTAAHRAAVEAIGTTPQRRTRRKTA